MSTRTKAIGKEPGSLLQEKRMTDKGKEPCPVGLDLEYGVQTCFSVFIDHVKNADVCVCRTPTPLSIHIP